MAEKNAKKKTHTHTHFRIYISRDDHTGLNYAMSILLLCKINLHPGHCCTKFNKDFLQENVSKFIHGAGISFFFHFHHGH